MITIICLISCVLCFTYVGLLLINPDKWVDLFPPYVVKNKKKIKPHCWNCGRKGIFSGQVCPECFQKMEEQYQLEMEENNLPTPNEVYRKK